MGIKLVVLLLLDLLLLCSPIAFTLLRFFQVVFAHLHAHIIRQYEPDTQPAAPKLHSFLPALLRSPVWLFNDLRRHL